MVQEELPWDYRTGSPWELLFVDDLALTADGMEGVVKKFK